MVFSKSSSRSLIFCLAVNYGTLGHCVYFEDEVSKLLTGNVGTTM